MIPCEKRGGLAAYFFHSCLTLNPLGRGDHPAFLEGPGEVGRGPRHGRARPGQIQPDVAAPALDAVRGSGWTLGFLLPSDRMGLGIGVGY